MSSLIYYRKKNLQDEAILGKFLNYSPAWKVAVEAVGNKRFYILACQLANTKHNFTSVLNTVNCMD